MLALSIKKTNPVRRLTPSDRKYLCLTYVYITRLRNHLRSDNSVEIESIRGVGYKLKC